MRKRSRSSPSKGINIVAMAFELTGAVTRFVGHARRFFYEVMLSGHHCTRCGGRLAMIAESRCRCTSCGAILDPTAAFQRCSACGGKPRLRVRRYRCQGCGRDVQSSFVFDGMVFDQEYFRQRMAESRQRKQERRLQSRRKVVEERSGQVDVPSADIQSVPGLVDALNQLSSGIDLAPLLPLCKGFDLNRYQAHILAHIEDDEERFDTIPPLDPDRRLDRIWRFIAIIFLAHAGQVEIQQEGRTITVRRHEAH